MDYGLDKVKSFIFYNVVCFYYIKNKLISVLWINAYGWSWFEAKDLCRSNGTIGTTSKSNTYFWTKYYQRRSHWIATLGNHN